MEQLLSHQTRSLSWPQKSRVCVTVFVEKLKWDWEAHSIISRDVSFELLSVNSFTPRLFPTIFIMLPEPCPCALFPVVSFHVCFHPVWKIRFIPISLIHHFVQKPVYSVQGTEVVIKLKHFVCYIKNELECIPCSNKIHSILIYCHKAPGQKSGCRFRTLCKKEVTVARRRHEEETSSGTRLEEGITQHSAVSN